MNKYQVELTSKAQKDLERIDQRRKVAQKILEIEDDPLKGHLLEGSLKSVRSLVFSLPGGAYRAAYIVLEIDKICLVFIIGPHENFYDKAERRYQAVKKSILREHK